MHEEVKKWKSMIGTEISAKIKENMEKGQLFTVDRYFLVIKY